MSAAMKLEKLAENQPLLLAGAVLAVVVLILASRAAKAGAELASAAASAAADTIGGTLTGNNAVTEGATNADGEPTDAYVGAGIVGTVGAATNAVSGGVLASVGQSIGGWFARVTGADRDDEIAAMLKGTVTTKPGAGQAQAYSTSAP